MYNKQITPSDKTIDTRMWMTKQPDDDYFHTVNYCPICRAQRTWRGNLYMIFMCLRCGYKMKYNSYEKKLVFIEERQHGENNRPIQ